MILNEILNISHQTLMRLCTSIIGLTLSTSLFFSCTSHPSMPASPLITHALHADSRQNCFEGVWYNPAEKGVWTEAQRNVYVAPININYVKTHFPKKAPALAEQFRQQLEQDIRTILAAKTKASGGKTSWKLVSRPTPGCLTLEIALVKLKATDAGGNIVSELVSLISPIPGTSLLLGHFMDGDVGLEGRLVNTRTSANAMEFKAYNTDPITLISVKEFERFAFDSQNLQDFAKEIAAIFRSGPDSTISGADKIDLDPF